MLPIPLPSKVAANTALACLLVLSLTQAASPAEAQQELYSHTSEYRAMLEELHSDAPSPARIATGALPTADRNLKPQVQEDDLRVRWTTAASEFVLDKSAATLSLHSRRTSAAWSISIAGSCDHAAPGSPSVSSVVRKENEWIISTASACGRSTITMELLTDVLTRLTLHGPEDPASHELQLHVQAGAPVFGLGERFAKASLGGTNLDVRPQDHYGEPGHNWVYVAIPFVYTPGGLGLYADTASDTNFRFNEQGSSFDLRIASHSASLYLFSEPDPESVLSAYTAVTGHPQNPPLWTFGPWITSLQGKGAVLDAAHRIRVEGVPASALWVYDELDDRSNLGWPFWFGSYYGDPRAFTDTLHGQGFRVLTYVHPYVREQVVPYTIPSPNYDKGVSEKLLMTGADGLPAGPRFEDVRTGNVDFTNPAAVDWWQTMITSAVRDQGFDGWMEDFGEWVRDSDSFSAGKGTVLSEIYPLLYHKVTLRIAQSLNPEVVPFARSGAPGSQQFSPVLWGADQFPNWSRDYGLPSVVTAGITAGMSGFSTWGPDIMSAGTSRELWMRWVEFGALSPVMRDHVWSKPEHSVNVWSDPETTSLFRRYAILHSSLLPFFVTYAEQAHRTGVPIMRHTVLEYPDDPRSATAEYQYLLGKELLVAPIVEPGASLRTLYLPRGEWLNYWNGDSLTGGQDVTVVAPVDQIPMLVRAGSILPFKPESEAATFDWSDPHLLESSLVWKAYPSATEAASGRFTLPNGTSADLQQHGEAIAINGKSKTVRNYEIILRSRLLPRSVRLNGAPFAAFTKSSAGQPASQWWWNPSTAEAHILFRAADFRLDMDGVTATQYTK